MSVVYKFVKDTLEPIGYPVSFQTYLGKEDTYITYFFYNQKGEMYADDEEVETGYYLQVDIWSKSDYTSLVKQVKDNMINAGFVRTSEADMYEKDTAIFHKSLRFSYAD